MKLTNVKRFESWLNDAASSKDPDDLQALHTGQALVWFWREVMRIMHDETPMEMVGREILDSIFESDSIEAQRLSECDCAVCEQAED